MGMAASQARFLGLTARKTNTEYEGQQVNQQRTALANESSGLFNKMLELQVPIPPDTNNFYNIRYTYTYGSEGYEITNFKPAATSGTYDITVKHSAAVDKAYKQELNNVELTKNASTGLWNIAVGSTTAQLQGPIEKANLATEMGVSNKNFYQYKDANNKTYYMNEDDFNTYTQNQTQDYNGGIQQYYYTSTTDVKYETIEGVTFSLDSNGSFTKVNVPGQGEMPLTTERVRDDIGYENAMRVYTMEKNDYDRAVADMNAQTSIIQQQDRTLELRLKQLDTEQSALQTELEAVTKVIEKNVESTFKTFA